MSIQPITNQSPITLRASQKHPGPEGAEVFPGSFAGAGTSQTFCERIPNFTRWIPLHLALFSHFLHVSSRIGLKIPSSQCSGGRWRRCPQPVRILAKAWYKLLNLQRKSADATVVWLKLPTTPGIQDFTLRQNLHCLPPPWRNLSRAYPHAVAQR